MAKTIGGVRGDNNAANKAARSMLNELAFWGRVADYEVTKLTTKLSEQEIIERLGGADKTRGSCASLALAYAANKAGMNVLDFRDGQSRRFWATHFTSFAQKFGGKIISDYNQIRATRSLLAEMKEGHEYILSTGKHAAIVRKGAKGYEYLELQDEPARNGFHPLDKHVLYDRFKADAYHTCRGRRTNTNSTLTDIRNIRDTEATRELMGSINTPVWAQHKGKGGGIK